MKKKKIQTIITCPKCGTKTDIINIKKAIKQRLDLEFDEIIERI